MPKSRSPCSLRACGKTIETPHKVNSLRAVPQTLIFVVLLGLAAISGVKPLKRSDSADPQASHSSHLLTRHRNEELISM